METGLSSVALHRLSRLVTELTSAEVPLADLLRSLADTAREVIGAHQATCGLYVDGAPSNQLNATSLSEKYAAWSTWAAPLEGDGITGWAREENRSMRMTQDELLAHPRWRGFGHHADAHPPMRGWLVAPFVGPNGNNVGLLQVSDRFEGEFTDADVEVAEFLASIGSAAIENRRLVDESNDARRRLQAVTDALPGGIVARDAEGHITFTNRWLADYLHLERSELDQSSPGAPYVLTDEMRVPLPPDRYPSVRASNGESFDSTNVGIPGPDGQFRWLATSGRPLVDDKGQTIGGLIVFVDNTEQVEAARRLANSELQLRDAQRLAGIGSWTRTLSTGETTVSDEFRRLVGLGPDDPVDREILYHFIHPDDRAAVFEATFRTFADGTPYAGVTRAIDVAGEELTVEIHAARFHGPDGHPAGLFGTVRDLTAVIEQEEQLARAQRMETIGRLAGGLAHDFNNLLTVLSGHAELLRMSQTAAQGASIEAIVAAIDRASRLTRQLLEYGRRDVLQPESVDIDGLVTQLHTMARSAVPSEIELVLEHQTEPVLAWVDPRKLEQVLLNLILNARDALVDRGRIVVRTDVATVVDQPSLHPGRYVRLTVTDDGPGMSSEVLDRAMEPFFTTKPRGAGTGLGLATSYGIVGQSGGLLTLESEAGTGTTVTVLLPVATAPNSDADDDAPGPLAAGRATILLAEDDAQLRPLLVATLARHGHRVLEAVDGEDALAVAAAAQGPIDLLLTDVSMPRRGGHELATMLTSVHPSLRVLYMSGYTDDTVVRNAATTGMIDFIGKPFRLEQLLRQIDIVLLRPGRDDDSDDSDDSARTDASED